MIKWTMTGQFAHQHDPDFLANGNILLFDNRGGNGEYGQSQILEINPNTQKIVWRYRGNAQWPFFSQIRGSQQPLPNGNVLITESDGGRLLEVTRAAEPEIVWEY
jgi:Arylsulfotransferase (ASST)